MTPYKQDSWYCERVLKILSVNVGLPRSLLKEIITTGIFKISVEGQVNLRKLNLDGDKQADLTVHGEDKAAYAYPVEHYEYWQHELPNTNSP